MKGPQATKTIQLGRACPVCDSGAGRRLFSKKTTDAVEAFGFGYDVVVCSKCGFGFADAIPKQAALDTYYQDMSKYDAAGVAATGPDYQQAYFSTITRIIRERFSDPATQILDVGCATGRLLSFLQEAGYINLLGLDPSPKSAVVARKLYDVEVAVGSFFNFKPSYTFDLIILSGVLEHIASVKDAVRRITELLSPEGAVYICVPDASRFCEGENAPFQEFSHEHINFFGPVSLANLMATVDLEPIENGFYQELVTTAPKTTSPVIHAVFRKRDTAPTTDVPPYDEQTQKALTDYIAQSLTAMRTIRKRIENVVVKGEPIVIWGAGAHTLNLFATTSMTEANIVAFVDSNKNYHGRTLRGLPILAPEDLIGRPEPILVSSRVYQEEIRSQIRTKLGLGNELILLYNM